MGHLGDVLDPSLRRTLQQWNHLGRRRWIVKPEWFPDPIPGGEVAQHLIETHALPRLWQLLADNFELLKTGIYRVQKPGWIEPPAGSEPEDIVSENPVALSNGAAVVVITYQVPDRHVAAFPRFGHLLDVAAQWGTVTWTIQVNGKPVRTYHNFKQQRGTVVDPTMMANVLKLKPKDVLEVTATGGATAVNAIARMPGWLIPAAAIVQDGSGEEWKVR